MIARLQANHPLNTAPYGGVDIKVTWDEQRVFYNSTCRNRKLRVYADKDFMLSWGGFLVINEDEAQAFANKFFDGIDVESLCIEGELSPKILIVKPEARLSW